MASLATHEAGGQAVAVIELAAFAGRGWLPVAVDERRESVVLAEVGDFDPRASSFGAALSGLGERRVRLVPVAEFVASARALECGGPARIVAHVGRCGSTLLANLLALRPTATVLKEPTVLHPREPGLLRALLAYQRAAAHAAGRELVVKPTSWTCPALLAAAGDGTRWLLLWRDPRQVVASELAQPPRWSESPRALPGDGGGDPVEVFARTWAGIVEAFLPGPAPVRFLDYAALSADKPGALRAVQTWFALPGPDALPEGFDAESLRYSKSGGRSTFDPAACHHRPALGPDDAARVDALTAAAVRVLRADDRVLDWGP
jgi:hypothetical protein